MGSQTGLKPISNHIETLIWTLKLTHFQYFLEMDSQKSPGALDTTVLLRISRRISWYQRFCELENRKFREKKKKTPRTEQQVLLI